MENKWLKQSNLQACKHLFAFAIDMRDWETVAFEKDKQLAFNVQNIVNKIPKLPITLILTTDFEENIRKDSIWKDVQTDIITKSDIGYVIAEDQQSSERVSSLTKDSPDYLKYIRNINLMKKVLDTQTEETRRNPSDLINAIQKNLNKNYSNLRIDDEKWRNSTNQLRSFTGLGFDDKAEKNCLHSLIS